LYNRESLIVLAPYVTLEAGTGCVHTAPGHGREDYETGLQYDLDVYSPVDDAGRFTADVETFAGLEVFEANRVVNQKLADTGALLLEESLPHDYPHCWRCKKPVIFRATKQWFISLEKNDLRQKALEAIKEVSWIPGWGRDRIYGLVENRPDWCISRQRAWGSPITILYCRECDHMLINQEIIARVCSLIGESGADIWFTAKEEDLLPPDTHCPACGATTFRKETDILDVWFDSGVSYAAVMEAREDLDSPSDLYLEGSDQHRGWFHSALLCSVGTRRNVLTHGFVVDGAGKAMHKSGGNVISPLDLIKDYGAEIIRLWVAGEDYRDNIRLSDEILQRLTEAYRRIRNTCRYLLGNLSDFDPVRDGVPYEEMEELDRWALHQLHEMNERVRRAYADFEFHLVYHNLHNFCVLDLSSFYLDIIKDRLYVSTKDSPARRSAQTALDDILAVLVRLMAPVLSFTADEIWQHMRDAKRSPSVHMDLFVPLEDEYRDPELASRWEEIIKVRREVTKALEIARKEKTIGHSLDAHVILGLPDDLREQIVPYKDQLHSLFIVSAVELVSSEEVEGGFASEELNAVKIRVTASTAPKCERCWVHDPTVGEDEGHPLICKRCLKAVDGVKDLSS
jgi:isoleucyl-tRNA synthetase